MNFIEAAGYGRIINKKATALVLAGVFVLASVCPPVRVWLAGQLTRYALARAKSLANPLNANITKLLAAPPAKVPTPAATKQATPSDDPRQPLVLSVRVHGAR